MYESRIFLKVEKRIRYKLPRLRVIATYSLLRVTTGNRSIMCTLIEEIQLSGTDSCMQEVI